MFALLPLILSIAPEIARLIGGDKAGTTTAALTTAVRTVTGTEDPAAAAAALAADPAKAAELRVQLAKIAADADAAQRQSDLDQLKAALADVADARSSTLSLVKAGSGIAWGAPVVSVVVTVGFFVSFLVMLLSPTTSAGQPVDPGKAAILNILVGSLSAGFTAVIGYWLGSSAGSSRKDELLDAARQDATTSVPGDLVRHLLPPQANVTTARGADTTDSLNDASLRSAQAGR